MCRLPDCQRVDGLRESHYELPVRHWTRITKYYLAHYGEWATSPEGQARLKKAVDWFTSHRAKPKSLLF